MSVPTKKFKVTAINHDIKWNLEKAEFIIKADNPDHAQWQISAILDDGGIVIEIDSVEEVG